ncbi:hypothetical protein LDG_5339 [Legionella drancourtii LLAP12]|uniref:Uncharacterized protein n=1 Tax=Legionella drancourtii LLAP12 TaxID=658187 RepID=G9EJH6_9GAMM|nr:hypothetical protein LDG_5339 [Legionella drancourtii LLAP12]
MLKETTTAVTEPPETNILATSMRCIGALAATTTWARIIDTHIIIHLLFIKTPFKNKIYTPPEVT